MNPEPTVIDPNPGAECQTATLPVLTCSASVARGVFARLRDVIMAQVPFGYQDAMGFHYGKPDYHVTECGITQTGSQEFSVMWVI